MTQVAAQTLLIVVHYGNPERTSRTLESVAAGSAVPGSIAVVDNGPSPGLGGSLASAPDAVRLGTGDRNLGFAGAVNLALDRALEPGHRFVWLLNNDAEVEPVALEELLAASARARDRSLVSSLVREMPSGRIWFTRATFQPWWLRTWLSRRRLEAGTDDLPAGGSVSWRSVPFLPGCSLLLPRPVLDAVGSLDDTFFLYGEDVDLSARAQRAGCGLVLATRSIVHHATSSGSSGPAKARRLGEASLRLTARWYPWLLPIAVPGALLDAARRAVATRQLWLLTSRLRGYADAVGPLPRRPSGRP